MSLYRRAAPVALILAGMTLAGCANDGDNLFTTGAIGPMAPQATAAAEPQIDPACVALAARIDGLRKEGIADKIEKAAAKKYKMTHKDLTKADQLTKSNAEFQLRCSTITPRPATAQAPAPAAPVAAAPAAAPVPATAAAPKSNVVAVSEGSLN
jgi:hypothetical protein